MRDCTEGGGGGLDFETSELLSKVDVSKLETIFTQLSKPSQKSRGKRGYIDVKNSNYLKKIK